MTLHNFLGRTITGLAIAFAAVACTTPEADAALTISNIIDFETPDIETTTLFDTSFIQNGAEITTSTGFYILESDAFAYDGSQSFSARTTADGFTLSLENGDALSLTTIDFGETSRNALTDIEIFGTATTGQFFSEKYISDGVLGLETLDLTNDSAFSLYQFDEISFRPADLGRGAHYDNIGYTTAVPEPGTTALILGGAALLATGIGRQRAKTPKP